MKQLLLLSFWVSSLLALQWYQLSQIPLKAEQDLPNQIDSKKWVAILFFSIRCPACQNSKDQFQKLYKWLSTQQHDQISFIRINGVDHRDLIIKYQIPVYPTLLILQRGTSKPIATYPNCRTGSLKSADQMSWNSPPLTKKIQNLNLKIYTVLNQLQDSQELRVYLIISEPDAEQQKGTETTKHELCIVLYDAALWDPLWSNLEFSIESVVVESS